MKHYEITQLIHAISNFNESCAKLLTAMDNISPMSKEAINAKAETLRVINALNFEVGRVIAYLCGTTLDKP